MWFGNNALRVIFYFCSYHQIQEQCKDESQSDYHVGQVEECLKHALAHGLVTRNLCKVVSIVLLINVSTQASPNADHMVSMFSGSDTYFDRKPC